MVEQSKEGKIIENDFLCTTKIVAAFLSHQSFIIQTCVTPEDDKWRLITNASRWCGSFLKTLFKVEENFFVLFAMNKTGVARSCQWLNQNFCISLIYIAKI